MSIIHTEKALRRAACAFLGDRVESVLPCGSGLINSTYEVSSANEKYILQCINTSIFRAPDLVMENISGVTGHLRSNGVATLCYMRTSEGGLLFYDGEGGAWRMNVMVPGRTFEALTPELFRECALTFGRFQSALSDFDASLLHETIPGFHDTAARYASLCRACARDPEGRVSTCGRQIDFAHLHSDKASLFTDMLRDKTLPLRVVHNDTKLNNCVIDDAGKGVCVIDLDTVMPGTLLYDFGDAVRSGASTRPEGSLDFDNTHISLELYEAFTSGFLEGVGLNITQAELENLPMSAFMLAYELGMRFLTDYIEGDVYFRTSYPTQNLDRAQGQFVLAQDILSKTDTLSLITGKIYSSLKA